MFLNILDNEQCRADIQLNAKGALLIRGISENDADMVIECLIIAINHWKEEIESTRKKQEEYWLGK